MNLFVSHALNQGLTWFPDLGVGCFLSPQKRKEDYFDEYKGLKGSEIGVSLLRFRCNLVNKFIKESRCLDIGIGSGDFVERRSNTFGYDVDLKSIRWLRRRGLWCNPYLMEFLDDSLFSGVSFWDSFEHLPNPGELLKLIRSQFIFISTPVFHSLEHLKSSKHLKPEEHVYYFTHQGLKSFMKFYGFNLLYSTKEESSIGREDIETFVFQREMEESK